jgi:acyl dehydratase
MSIQQRDYPALTRQQICRYAGAVRDFNPIHVDEPFAKASGMPSVIAHGPLTLAFAIDSIVSQVGAGSLRKFTARLKAPYTPGETLSIVPTDSGVELRTGSGTVVATATVELA